MWCFHCTIIHNVGENTDQSQDWFYKSAKVKLERDKNNFYDFLQTTILPISTQNIAVNINNLQKNINVFNENFEKKFHSFKENFKENFNTFDSKFKKKLDKLDKILGKNYDSIKGQQFILASLEKIDIPALAKINIDTFDKLEKNAVKFNNFGSYLEKMTIFIENTKNITIEVQNLTTKVQSLFTHFET